MDMEGTPGPKAEAEILAKLLDGIDLESGSEESGDDGNSDDNDMGLEELMKNGTKRNAGQARATKATTKKVEPKKSKVTKNEKGADGNTKKELKRRKTVETDEE